MLDGAERGRRGFTRILGFEMSSDVVLWIFVEFVSAMSRPAKGVFVDSAPPQISWGFPGHGMSHSSFATVLASPRVSAQ